MKSYLIQIIGTNRVSRIYIHQINIRYKNNNDEKSEHYVVRYSLHIFARKCYALPIKRQRAGKSCFLSIINKKDCIGNRSSVIYKNFCDAFLINYKYVWKDAKYCTQKHPVCGSC